MAWVLFEYLKKSVGNSGSFCRVLRKLASLALPKEEEMVLSSVAWTTAKHLGTLQNRFAEFMPDCLAALSAFDFPPSEGYSHLLRVAHNCRGQWTGHVGFCQWWDFGKLMPNDFERQTNEQGQKYMSLAETNFVTPDLQTGFFGYGRMKGVKPQRGQTYHAYFTEFGDGKASRIAFLDKCQDASVWRDVVTEFTGVMRISKDRTFGQAHCTIGDVFVPKDMLCELQAGDIVAGKAAKSFDKKKGRWGWMALSLHKG